MRPVLIACAIGLLIIPVILTLSILNVEVLPQLKPQQAIAALDRPEGTRSAQSVTSFSDRWFGDQSRASSSDLRETGDRG